MFLEPAFCVFVWVHLTSDVKEEECLFSEYQLLPRSKKNIKGDQSQKRNKHSPDYKTGAVLIMSRRADPRSRYYDRILGASLPAESFVKKQRPYSIPGSKDTPNQFEGYGNKNQTIKQKSFSSLLTNFSSGFFSRSSCPLEVFRSLRRQ